MSGSGMIGGNMDSVAESSAFDRFLAEISVLRPDRDIICGRRGSEENVKIKIILPMLRYLGYNIARDADFELMQADVVLRNEELCPILSIETKAWEQELSRYLNQCLEYTFKLRCPFIVITSGRYTALYSSLGNIDDLGNAKALLEFSFNDLLGSSGRAIMERLKSFVGKENLLSGASALYTEVAKGLPVGMDIDGAQKEFHEKCAGFKASVKHTKTDDSEFEKVARMQPPEVVKALLFGKSELERIAKAWRNVTVRYRSKEIGLEYLLTTGPRKKSIGLLGIYPDRAKFAFGIEGWGQIGCPRDIVGKIKAFPREIKTTGTIESMVKLIESALSRVQERA